MTNPEPHEIEAAKQSGIDWAHGEADRLELERLNYAAGEDNEYSAAWERGENGVEEVFETLYPDGEKSFEDFLDAAFDTDDEAEVEQWIVRAFVDGAIEALHYQKQHDTDGDTETD